ncbi:hypothetical protein ES703_83649 [subsurface metagenome]
MELKEINEAISTYVRPQTFPLAIRMCQAEELPERVRLPQRDLGIKIALCQAITMARRYGWVLAQSLDDSSCSIGALSLGFAPPKEGWLDGSFGQSMGQSKEMAAKSAQNLPRLEYKRYSHILMAPLERADFEPQVITVYGNPAQITRLVQSRLTEGGGSLLAKISGGGTCVNCVTLPILSDECQVSMPGAGERINCSTHDHEMACAIPISKIEGIVKGLETGHRGGISRYPTPSHLRFQPQHPPHITKLWEYLKGES